MNGDANTKFTSLDQYEPEGHVAYVAARSEVAAPIPELDFPEALNASPAKLGAFALPATAEPTSFEPRRRWGWGRVSLALAAVVLVVQAGFIFLTMAARQTRSDRSQSRVEPAGQTRDHDTSSQVMTAKADNQGPPHSRRDVPTQPQTSHVPANRHGDAGVVKAPKATTMQKASLASPAAGPVASVPAGPPAATLTVLAAVDDAAAASAARPGTNSPQSEADTAPTPAETAAFLQPVHRDAELLSFVRPTYPDAAKQSGITGGVEIDMTIDTSGRVVRSLAVSGPRLLRTACESALRQWRFRPASVDGTPVSSRRRYLVSFSAPSPDAPEGTVQATEPHNP